MEQNLPKMGREAYVELLESFNRFFTQQSRILLKEIKTIKYATNYYRKYESEYKSFSGLGQELLELEIIYDGIRYLETKVKVLLEQFIIKKQSFGEFCNLIQKIKLSCDNSHIAILPIMDSKIRQFQDLFDELNFYKQSYFNLIDSKEFPYIPLPKFNKRFRNANLGLFLNKQLNDDNKNSYRQQIAQFYKENNFATDTNIDNFNQTRFFAKWGYSTNHYIKRFNSLSNIDKNRKNIYISMSYAYLDKTLLHPIAFHEISHAIEHEKMSLSDTRNLEESLFTFRMKSIFRKNNPLDNLYKEILCDLSAVYATGYSYIMSLIHIGFFELENLFIEFNESEPYRKVESANKEAKKLFKIESNESIVPKRFDFNINNIDLAVRFLILLELCNKLEIKDTYINGIKYMLNVIFPPIFDENPTNHEDKSNTFLAMYEFMSDSAPDYKQSRNLVYSLYEKFQSLILTDKLINNFKLKKEENIFFEFRKKIKNSLPLFSTDIEECKSIFDLLWLFRENNLNNIGQKIVILERDINRLFNIFSVFFDDYQNGDSEIRNMFENIFKDFFDSEKSLFYNFEFIKYKSTKDFHPFVEFMKVPYDGGYNKNMSYIFAPYDIALLKEVNNKSTLQEEFEEYPFKRHNSKTFDDKREKNKYFIDRHSLFLLSEINGENDPENNPFSSVIQIKIEKIFSEEDSQLMKFLLEYFKDKKEHFTKCRIFKSMGVEDYLVYVQGLNLKDTKLFGKSLISQYNGGSIEVEDLILLEHQYRENIFSDDIDLKNLEIISFAKMNINNNASKEYFNCDTAKNKLFPTIGAKLMKTPTNRYDCIINWEVDKSIFNNIKNHLEQTYYSKEETESIYSDFNIEIMHTISKQIDT